MARHTIVIELPDAVDADVAEERITAAIERIGWSRQGRRNLLTTDFAKVTQYHHEQIPEEGGE